VLAVHQTDQEAFLLLESIIAKADRILDHIVSAAFVFLRRDREILPDSNAYVLAPFYVGSAWRKSHGSSQNLTVRRDRIDSEPGSNAGAATPAMLPG
jgi:hypothetical protein